MPDAPRPPYRVIVADPPWTFEDGLPSGEGKPRRGAVQQYPLLTLECLRSLPVADMAAPDGALLALWTPATLLTEGLAVLDAWGFAFKQVWVWVKLTPRSTAPSNPGAMPAIPGTLHFGMGRLARASKELVLVGTRGRYAGIVGSRSERDVFFAPVGAHSVKPEALQDMIERLIPEGPYLELFARRDRLGWRCVGFDAPETPGEDMGVSLARLRGEANADRAFGALRALGGGRS